MNFWRGVRGVARALLGIDPAPPQVIASRRSLCRQCPVRRGKRCGACGCVVELKTMNRDESCPLGVW